MAKDFGQAITCGAVKREEGSKDLRGDPHLFVDLYRIFETFVDPHHFWVKVGPKLHCKHKWKQNSTEIVFWNNFDLNTNWTEMQEKTYLKLFSWTPEWKLGLSTMEIGIFRTTENRACFSASHVGINLFWPPRLGPNG